MLHFSDSVVAGPAVPRDTIGTEDYYIINSERSLDVNRYITFSNMNSK